jgi:hypothetical protein
MENIADLFLLRKDITFLNFGSFGATPAPILMPIKNGKGY